MEEFYRIPLTSGEAETVLAVLKAIERLTGPGGGIDTDVEPGILPSAIARIAEELPEYKAGKADRLAQAIEQAFREVLAEGIGSADNEDDERTTPPFPIRRTRRLLEDAYEHDLPVEIDYFVASRNEWTTRVVDISGITVDGGGNWKLSGQCGLRGDYRHFRLDHIRSVRVLENRNDDLPDPFEDE